MNQILRLSYYLSIFTIIVWLVRPILFWIIGLEFVDSLVEIKYSYSWRYILPIAICLTISKEYINGRSPKSQIKSILIRIILSTLSVVLVFLSLFMNMCGWVEKDVIFESKQNLEKIVLMKYDCGALDSDPNPTQKIKKIKPLNSLFKLVQNCDTTSINLNKWIKVK